MRALLPICHACTHLDFEDAEHGRPRCTAFPDGVPDAIFRDGRDHRDPYPGDHGIRFKLDRHQGAEESLATYERHTGHARV